MYVFDSSSIINLVKRGLAKVFEHGITIELALYESLNAIWKEYKLLGKIEEDIALKYINVLAMVFEAIKIMSIKGFEKEVFNIASKEDLTIYDASYLLLALRNHLVLVTDDKKLRDKASRYINVLTSADVARKYGV